MAVLRMSARPRRRLLHLPAAALVTALVGCASSAWGQEEPAETAAPEIGELPSYPRIDLGGYVEGGFGFRLRPEALPRDEIDYGFFGVAGLSVEGWAHEMWRARLQVEFRSDALETVTDVDLFDLDEDAAPELASFTVSRVPGIVIQEATAGFQPSPLFAIEAGITRIPFTLSQQSKNNALMFPTRAPANEIFLSGADLGALARLDLADGIFITSVGAFNGSSLGLRLDNATPRGVVFAYRGDLSPLGRFRFGEGDLERGPFRLGFGFGATFWPATLFDERTGTEPRTLYDLRLSGSLRMAWSGFYAVVEYFRRQQEDDFSLRPEVADGAYGQLAYFILIADRYGLEPMARPGFVAADQTFDPRITGYVDAGINFYPIAGTATPDAVKLTVAYLGERRFSEQEQAHGGAVELRVKF